MMRAERRSAGNIALRRERRWVARARLPQTRNQIIDLTQPLGLTAVDILIPKLAELALRADAPDRQDRLVHLRVVRLMGVTVHPTAYVIRQPFGCVTGTGSGQLRSRDRLARRIEAKVVSIAQRAIKR